MLNGASQAVSPYEHAQSRSRTCSAMRGDIVYRVYGLHEGRQKDFLFGVFRSRSEADAEIAKLCAREMNGRNWADQYHNRGFVIRDTVVDIDFEIPSYPKPRDKYAVRGITKVKSAGDVGLDHRRSISTSRLCGRPRESLRIRTKLFAASDL